MVVAGIRFCVVGGGGYDVNTPIIACTTPHNCFTVESRSDKLLAHSHPLTLNVATALK